MATRITVFREIFNTLNGTKPTYTNKDGGTSTFTILSSFPEVTPTFPCIVINPIEQDLKFLGVADAPNKIKMAAVDIEFYTKTRDGKNAIDAARESVQSTLLAKRRWTTFIINMEDPFDDSPVDTIEVGEERLNTATITMNVKLR